MGQKLWGCIKNGNWLSKLLLCFTPKNFKKSLKIVDLCVVRIAWVRRNNASLQCRFQLRWRPRQEPYYYNDNRYINTWMLHFMHSNNLILQASWNIDANYPPPLPHYLPSYWMNNLPRNEAHIYNINGRQIFTCQYIHVFYIHYNNVLHNNAYGYGLNVLGYIYKNTDNK